MKCVKCDKDNTKCINDMLTQSYTAEIYTCLDCLGTIEVVYNNARIAVSNIKEYTYYSASTEVQTEGGRKP